MHGTRGLKDRGGREGAERTLASASRPLEPGEWPWAVLLCCDPKHLKTTRPDRPCPLPSHNTGCYTQSPHRARPVLPWPVRAMRLCPSYCERGVSSHISSTYCTRPVRSWPVRVLRLCPSYCKRGVSSPLSYISHTACPSLACPCHAIASFILRARRVLTHLVYISYTACPFLACPCPAIVSFILQARRILSPLVHIVHGLSVPDLSVSRDGALHCNRRSSRGRGRLGGTSRTRA